MSRYRGSATLISSDGAEVEVYVDLRAKQREWSGTATIVTFATWRSVASPRTLFRCSTCGHYA